MSTQTAAERDMAVLLIEALHLDDRDADSVDPAAPLFGDAAKGWGLDSIDALEIALAIQQKYGIELKAENEATKRAFASLRALTEYIAAQRPQAVH
ncbi:MAG: phosphopantetheine-binding protein [Solimonas sp.]